MNQSRTNLLQDRSFVLKQEATLTVSNSGSGPATLGCMAEFQELFFIAPWQFIQ
jgi:hypothetical protein